MKQPSIKYSYVNMLATCCLAAGLTACGGGGGGGGGSASSVSAQTAQVDNIAISGSVGDGPIVGATISIYASNGRLLTTLTSDSYAKYSANFKVPNGSYPLIIEATGGTDIVTGVAPDFKLVSVVEQNTDTQVNLNPYSTLIVETARKMPGGIKSSNINSAQQIVMASMNYGLDSSLVKNPIKTTITTNNIASIVKSSETFGEMIRRTRDNLAGTVSSITADDVVRAIAADMSDGSLDGKGASGVDPRITAVSKLAAGQVTIEAMSNSLRVNGVLAESSIDSAIMTTLPTVSSSSLSGSVLVNAEIIAQAKESVAAAYAISPSLSLATLSNTLDKIVPGSDPQTVSSILPGDSSSDMTQSITTATYANSQELEAVLTASSSTTSATPTNSSPILSGVPSTSVQLGATYSFTPSASDPDGDALSFSISNRPAWAAFNISTGRLSGTPTTSDLGITANIVISVTDGKTSVSLPAFSVTVNAITPSNSAPLVSNSPATSVNQGSAYSYTPAATDPDGDSLSFSITNKPSWATFNTSTGKLSGIPANANVGTTTGITITVSDGITSTTVGPFSITVVNVNDPPTISGTPSGSAVEGQLYSFRPTANDIDGDALTFSITNKPSWMTFNTSTGQLSGTPSASNVGSTGTIVISVSDGKASTALTGFIVTVAAAQPTTGSVALSWNAPTTRADGSALSMSEIAGYVVHYGTAAGSYPNSVDIPDAYTMQYTFANLPQGTYYFVVTAYDTVGQVSSYSSSISTVVQ